MIDETDRDRAVSNEHAPGSWRWLEAVAGGLVLSILSFAIVLYAAYHGWYAQDLPNDWAYAGAAYGFMFYAMGAYIFAYGWEQGDMGRTVRLGTFIVGTTFVTIVVLILLMKLRGEVVGEAASAGSAMTDPASMLETAGSMLTAQPETLQPKLSHLDAPFQMTCGACGRSFAPAPPNGKCRTAGRRR
jgi:hypothetical protein